MTMLENDMWPPFFSAGAITYGVLLYSMVVGVVNMQKWAEWKEYFALILFSSIIMDSLHTLFSRGEYAPVEDQLTQFQDLRRRDTVEMDCGIGGSDARPETSASLSEPEDEGSGGFSSGVSSHVGSGNHEGEEEGMMEGAGVSEGTAEDASADGSPARSKVRSGRSHSGSRKKTR